MIKEMELIRSLVEGHEEIKGDYHEPYPKMVLIKNKIYRLRVLPDPRNICMSCKHTQERNTMCKNSYYLVIDEKYINLCWDLDDITIKCKKNMDKRKQLELILKGEIKKARIVTGEN